MPGGMVRGRGRARPPYPGFYGGTFPQNCKSICQKATSSMHHFVPHWAFVCMTVSFSGVDIAVY